MKLSENVDLLQNVDNEVVNLSDDVSLSFWFCGLSSFTGEALLKTKLVFMSRSPNDNFTDEDLGKGFD